MPGTKPNHQPWARSSERHAPLGGALGVAGVEEADVDAVGVPGVHRHVGATLDEGHSGRRRQVTAEGPGGGGGAWRCATWRRA